MAYEIYYTSATQGLKRGAQGFCTVAATEGIPPSLMQRLEALSGYRHHFAPGDVPSGNNPVAHAHWTINLAGKTYHVLSRISDAGFDYTHRTNSLAHHIALEASELPPAGPAWMLAQPGVMIDHWDGQVGPISRSGPLPFEDISPARCDAWQRITGDAGWGGMLADALAKSPTKPICILFTPDQNILGLIEESVRLLPPALRWQATFNTYFTSMPTSVVCAWRCCLAGTPAAIAAARYGSGGLVINLTDPGSLGEAPTNTWVTVARTGVAPLTPVPAKTAAKFSRPPVAPVQAQPTMAEPVHQSAPAPVPVQPFDELLTASHESKYSGPRLPKPVLRGIPQLTSAAAGELNRIEQRRRRQMVLMYSAAVLAIGIGILAVVAASRSTTRAPVIIPPTSHPVEPADVQTEPAAVAPVAVQPAAPAPHQPIVETPAPPPPHPEPVPVVIKPVAPPPPPPPEQTIVMRGNLARSAGGSGLQDATQEIDLSAPDAARLRLAAALGISFPGDKTTYPYKHADLSGVLSATAETGSQPSLLVQWTDTASPDSTADVMEIQLDKSRGKIVVTWKSSFMLRHPDVGSLAFWIVQRSTLLAHQPGKPAPHRVVFASPKVQQVDLLDAANTLHFPGDFPPDCVLISHPAEMPAGWQATPIPSPDKDATVLPVLINKHTRVAVLDAVFHLTVKSDWSGLESDFAAQQKLYADSADKFQRDLAQVDQEISQIGQDDPQLAELNKELTDDLQLQTKSDADRHEAGYTRATLTAAIAQLRVQIQDQQASLDTQKAPLQAKRGDFDQLYQGYREATADLADLKAFDLSVTLPNGQAIATIHFVHN